MDDFKGVNLPLGNALTWDMTALTTRQLEYEYKICYECLYGAEVAGYPVLKGLMVHDHISIGCDEDQLARARSTWQQRLKRAEDELFERKLI